jgi:hypothetical protein
MSTAIQLGLFGGEEPVPEKKIDSRLTHWAVVEEETSHQKGVIWGVGNTRKEAIDDAAPHLIIHPDVDISDFADMEESIREGGLLVTRCTRKLSREVTSSFGGLVDFVLVSGAGAYLPEEVKHGRR